MGHEDSAIQGLYQVPCHATERWRFADHEVGDAVDCGSAFRDRLLRIDKCLKLVYNLPASSEHYRKLADTVPHARRQARSFHVHDREGLLIQRRISLNFHDPPHSLATAGQASHILPLLLLLTICSHSNFTPRS